MTPEPSHVVIITVAFATILTFMDHYRSSWSSILKIMRDPPDTQAIDVSGSPFEPRTLLLRLAVAGVVISLFVIMYLTARP